MLKDSSSVDDVAFYTCSDKLIFHFKKHVHVNLIDA